MSNTVNSSRDPQDPPKADPQRKDEGLTEEELDEVAGGAPPTHIRIGPIFVK